MIIPLQIGQNWDLTWLKLEWLQILKSSNNFFFFFFLEARRLQMMYFYLVIFLFGRLTVRGTVTRIIWRYWIWMDVAVEETRALVSTTPFLYKENILSNVKWPMTSVYNISKRSGCLYFQLWFLSHESFKLLSYSILFWGLNKEQALFKS